MAVKGYLFSFNSAVPHAQKTNSHQGAEVLERELLYGYVNVA